MSATASAPAAGLGLILTLEEVRRMEAAMPRPAPPPAPRAPRRPRDPRAEWTTGEWAAWDAAMHDAAFAVFEARDANDALHRIGLLRNAAAAARKGRRS